MDALWHAGECLTFVAHRYLQPKLAVAGNERTARQWWTGRSSSHRTNSPIYTADWWRCRRR